MAKFSENSIRLIEFLQGIGDKKMTAQEIAEALDLSVSQVNGAFTAMYNKKLGVREPATVKGAIDVTFIAATDEGADADREKMSEGACQVLDYLLSVKGQDITTDDAVADTGIDKKKFVATLTSLCKKGYAERIPAKVEGDISVKYLCLTDDGRALDTTATDED